MQRSLLGAFIGAGLVIAAAAGFGSSESTLVAQGNNTPQARVAGELITHVHMADDGLQTITVIDPQRKVMGIYHVNRGSGEITLKSVRNFNWDLQMIEFNSGKPLPQDIRNGLSR